MLTYALVALCAALLAAAGDAGAAGTTWDRNADWLQEQIQACAERTEEFACRYFPARALNQLFGIGEFCNDERCLLSHEIAAELGKSGHWSALGQRQRSGRSSSGRRKWPPADCR